MYQIPGSDYAVSLVEHMAPSIAKDHLLALGYQYRIIRWINHGQNIQPVAYYKSKACAIRRCNELSEEE